MAGRRRKSARGSQKKAPGLARSALVYLSWKLWRGRASQELTRERRSPQNTVKTNRYAGYLRKANPLRHLCGGRLHRWLALWVLGRGRDSTPWPGWPASRLILARYVQENCSLPSTDRVTMDTITWRVRWTREPSPRWWRNHKPAATARASGIAASSWATLSKRSNSSHVRCAKPGAGKLPASQAPWARPQRKRSWRHCWARSCGS